MKHNYRQRIVAAIAQLRKFNRASALILSSAPLQLRSHDSNFPHRQDNYFYYLTGSTSQDLVLVIRHDTKRPLLIAPPPDPVKRVWEGTTPRPQQLAASIGAELRVTREPLKEVRSALRSVEILLHQPSISQGRTLAEGVRSASLAGARDLPVLFGDVRSALSELRLFKSPQEVSEIRQAAAITADALHRTLPLMRPGAGESTVANTLEYFVRLNGAESAFPPIVAAGRSAAVLHYHQHSRKLHKGELLLIDYGAEWNLYSADISRTIPLGAPHTPLLRVLYDGVLDTQRELIRAVRPAVSLQTLQDIAARRLTETLKELGVLKGPLASLVKRKAYRPYFPHSFGHSLGLDTHDVGLHLRNGVPSLAKDMVFTIEPGLYFSKPIAKLPACGVRIEDDVLVTRRGCEVLTHHFPKQFEELEDAWKHSQR